MPCGVEWRKLWCLRNQAWRCASAYAGAVTVLLDQDSRHHAPEALDGDKRPTYIVRSLQVGGQSHCCGQKLEQCIIAGIIGPPGPQLMPTSCAAQHSVRMRLLLCITPRGKQ
jgi:hypothetical protein